MKEVFTIFLCLEYFENILNKLSQNEFTQLFVFLFMYFIKHFAKLELSNLEKTVEVIYNVN